MIILNSRNCAGSHDPRSSFRFINGIFFCMAFLIAIDSLISRGYFLCSLIMILASSHCMSLECSMFSQTCSEIADCGSQFLQCLLCSFSRSIRSLQFGQCILYHKNILRGRRQNLLLEFCLCLWWVNRPFW